MSDVHGYYLVRKFLARSLNIRHLHDACIRRKTPFLRRFLRPFRRVAAAPPYGVCRPFLTPRPSFLAANIIHFVSFSRFVFPDRHTNNAAPEFCQREIGVILRISTLTGYQRTYNSQIEHGTDPEKFAAEFSNIDSARRCFALNGEGGAHARSLSSDPAAGDHADRSKNIAVTAHTSSAN